MATPAPSNDPVHLFGIRHHGPGCARSLANALADLAPDCLLIEGPPEGEAVLEFVDHPALVPPVALLVYHPENTRQAVFYPFATFSPEWVALSYARARALPIRFMDLPVATRFSQEEAREAAETVEQESAPPPAEVTAPTEPQPDQGDPLDWLGRAAGYGDGERWWNHMVEERGDSLALFAAIAEAMTVVRAEAPESAGQSQRDLLREAHMRKTLREAVKAGYQRIAVVCGAWHVPALAQWAIRGGAKADQDSLKAAAAGLGKPPRLAATWVPWTYRHLSRESGYGAGVDAPGWYEHLWQYPPGERSTAWLARAAALFRREGVDCSSAHLIEAARLADTLAALRERPQPGLEELSEALRAVVCLGDDLPMALIRDSLMVGDRLGTIPEASPAVPLQQDLSAWQKRLRLKPEALSRNLDLDLREANDLARSHLLHRLGLLGVPWGKLQQRGSGRVKGSFHEIWALQWAPELAISVIEASRWGNTVEEAATRAVVDRARAATQLGEVSTLVQQVLLADLTAAIAPVTQALENLAAAGNDVAQLLAALPPLAEVARYGNVRQTDAGMVRHLLQGLVPRAAIGLPGAATALDDGAAQALADSLARAHGALRQGSRPGEDGDLSDLLQTAWYPALGRLVDQAGVHGRVAGLAARLRLDDQADPGEVTARHFSRALSQGNDPGAAAAWLEGFLHGSALVLLHDDLLWSLVDRWLSGLGEVHFVAQLPLLRRAFCAFNGPERRQIAERAARPSQTGQPETTAAGSDPLADGNGDWDPARAIRPLPRLAQLLGIPLEFPS